MLFILLSLAISALAIYITRCYNLIAEDYFDKMDITFIPMAFIPFINILLLGMAIYFYVKAYLKSNSEYLKKWNDWFMGPSE